MSLVLGGLTAIIGRRRRYLGAGAATIGLIALITLVGKEPSVLRAGYMGVFVCLALALRRPTSAFPLLAITVIGVALADPVLATSLGFRLSVVATAAIVVYGYRMRRALSFLPAWLAELVAIPLIAGIATMPLIMSIQDEASVWSVLANILVAPVVAPVTITGLLGTLSLGIENLLGWTQGAAIPLPSALLIAIAAGCTWWIDAVARALIQLPGSGVSPIAAMSINLSVIALLLAVSWGYRHELLSTAVARAVVGAGLAVIALGGWFATSRGGASIREDWEIVQCDVGQGSATLARTEKGTILIDVGHEDSGVGECVVDAGVERIDLLVLTHFDSDHVRGLDDLLATVEVTSAWVSDNPYPHRNSSWVFGQLNNASVEVSRVVAGARYGTATGVISPSFVRGDAESTNDDSLVVSVRTASHHLLVLADTGEVAQDLLLGSSELAEAVAERGPVTVAGVAHHGSADQSPRLASALSPLVSLVAVGENTYGHPTKQALQAWSAPILRRTDECGMITVGSNWVASDRRCDVE